MATWDGSYPIDADDQNCFVYNQNSTGAVAKNWSYFASGENNTFLQHRQSYYPANNQEMYERNEPTVFYQANPNVLPMPSDMVPLGNTYQEQILPSVATNITQVSSDIEQSLKNVQALQDIPSSSRDSYNPIFKTNKTINKYMFRPKEYSTPASIQSSIVENSNLHPTANEFVPNGMRYKKDGFKRKDNYTKITGNNFNASAQEFKPKSAPMNSMSSSGNKYKSEKYYDKKRDINYKQTSSQDTQFSTRLNYKDTSRTYNGRNFNKFQNDKYYKKKYQSDASFRELHSIEKAHSSMANPTYSYPSSSREQKSSINELQKDDSSSNIKINTNRGEISMHKDNDLENIPLKAGGQQSSRPKRFNYTNVFNLHKPNSNCTQFELAAKNTRKYTDNVKNERHENIYKSDKNNFNVQVNYKGNYIKSNRNEKYDNKSGNNEMAIGPKDKKVENWRDKSTNNETMRMQKRHTYKKYDVDYDASQRERLTEQLNRGLLECLVCYELIKQSDYVWSCNNCYHVLHLKCIKKWAKSSQSENGWRCPACQNVTFVIPEDYVCFCGKMKIPEWNRRDVAHSCGEVCGRKLSKSNCVHSCTLLCHPGSCPLCVAMVTKSCGCGKTSQTVQCSTHKFLLCDSICGKNLPCGKHTCEKKCHHGECGSCDKTVLQRCFCEKETQEVPCQINVPDTYSCNNICKKLLNCGKHYCEKVCHPEDCESCSLMPERVTTCCCGQTLLTEIRVSCLDPVPTCDKICSKLLKCGQPSNPHTCKIPCHIGECPDCDLSTDVKCRCGNMDREIICKELTSKADDARCEKRCIKKRSCGKHKCNQLCCIDIEHICPLPCSKTLSCGKHRCEQRCHKGRCQPCWRSSFDELYCECGGEVIYPPVSCGTRRPLCQRPCSREHPCGHEVLHNCHSEATCPPCSVLTQRWCHGRHERRKAVPCHITEISCGLPCNKPLTCGRHKCITMCHAGSCERPGQQCIQPCVTTRELCEHICAAPCHEGKCPDTPCKEMVKVTCQCGHKSMSRVCADNAREYQRIASNILASKMADMQLGHSIDLEEVFGQSAKKQNQLKTLECNDECKTIERNRRLALGLQIVNPDLSGKLMPRYSDYMKQWAKKDSHFCQMVHDRLTELVQLAKTSKHKSRSYSFDSMNRDKRHFVHESCEHFGCESQAYDEEPKRNVVATAVKDKCWLPSYSLLEIVQRENGQRKVPGPVLNTFRGNSSTKTILSLPVRKSQKPLPSSSTFKSPDKEIDYFEYKG